MMSDATQMALMRTCQELSQQTNDGIESDEVVPPAAIKGYHVKGQLEYDPRFMSPNDNTPVPED